MTEGHALGYTKMEINENITVNNNNNNKKLYYAVRFRGLAVEPNQHLTEIKGSDTTHSYMHSLVYVFLF